MLELKAHESGIDYNTRYGFGTNGLGCVMWNTSSPWLDPDDFEKENWLYKYLKNNEYVSEEIPYVKGLASNWHMTVRYGFLPEVSHDDIKPIIEKIDSLMDIRNHRLFIGEIDVWPSINGEPYECVVARISVDAWLREIHDAFGILPNIATFSQYKPHVTLGYFEPGTWRKYHAMEIGSRLDVLGWRYGNL